MPRTDHDDVLVIGSGEPASTCRFTVFGVEATELMATVQTAGGA